MKINYKKKYPTIILSEKLTIENTELFKEKIDSVIEKGYQTIAIDFSQVENIDSLGLGKIILALIKK